MSAHYYDRDGSPLTLDEWAEKIGDSAYRLIAQDNLTHGFITTVWTGINYRPDDAASMKAPMLFVTIVFTSRKTTRRKLKTLPVARRTYNTLAEARAGHEQLKREWEEELAE